MDMPDINEFVEEVEDDLFRMEQYPTKEESDRLTFGFTLMDSLMPAVQERINKPEWFFFSPPTNFSYMLN